MSRGEPAWLTAKVDQRLALMSDKLGRIKAPMTMIMTPLTEPVEGASKFQMEIWERSCDNCGAYCSGDYYTGMAVREAFGTQVTFVYGVCPKCKELP